MLQVDLQLSYAWKYMMKKALKLKGKYHLFLKYFHDFNNILNEPLIFKI